MAVVLVHETGEAVEEDMITTITGALPTPSALWCGKIITVHGGVGARCRAYICLKSDAGTYHWNEWANGGAL